MPTFSVTELQDQRRYTTGNNPSVSYAYAVDAVTDWDDATDADADAAARAAIPTTVNGLERQAIELEEIAPGRWTAVVRWAPTKRQTPAIQTEPEVSAEGSLRSERVYQSIATIRKVAVAGAGTPPNFRGAVVVGPEGPEGADVPVPETRRIETHILSTSEWTTEYENTLIDLQGTVNNDTFKGRAAGEVRFDTYSARLRRFEDRPDDWEVTYQFSIRRNRASVTIAGTDIGDLEGWWLVWPYMGATEDAGVDRTFNAPRAWYVEQMLETADFSALGIGT